jgi:hypothetical protein
MGIELPEPELFIPEGGKREYEIRKSRRERHARVGMGSPDVTIQPETGLLATVENPTVSIPEVRTENVTFVMTVAERRGMVLNIDDFTDFRYLQNESAGVSRVRLKTGEGTEDSGQIGILDSGLSNGFVFTLAIDVSSGISKTWVNGRLTIEQDFSSAFWLNSDNPWYFGGDQLEDDPDPIKPLEIFFHQLPAAF